MKKNFTLFTGVIILLALKSSAQFTQNFDSETAATLSNNCWQLSNVQLNGTSNKYLTATLTSEGVTFMQTPYIQPNSTNVTVSFTYQLSAKLNNNSYRYIAVQLGSTPLTTITLDKHTATTQQSFSINTTIADLASWQQLMLTFTGSGDASTVIYIDNIQITGFDNVTDCTGGGAKVLPVKLVSFQGNKNNSKVTLEWTVAENEMNDHFEVEVSTNGKDFSTTGIVFATEKSGIENYTYTETNNTTGKLMYRLKMYDQSQEPNYSNIVVFQSSGMTTKTGISVIGNPVGDKLNISFESSSNQQMQLHIFDMNGRMHMQQTVNAMQGSNLSSISLASTIHSGVYVVELIDNTGNRLNTRFIK